MDEQRQWQCLWCLHCAQRASPLRASRALLCDTVVVVVVVVTTTSPSGVRLASYDACRLHVCHCGCNAWLCTGRELGSACLRRSAWRSAARIAGLPRTRRSSIAHRLLASCLCCLLTLRIAYRTILFNN